MRFAIMLSDLNPQGKAPQALSFCQALLASGHQLSCLFLSGQSVQLTTSDTQLKPWQAIAYDAGIEISLCSASAKALGLTPSLLPERCGIAGLGYWLDQDLHAERSLRFGS